MRFRKLRIAFSATCLIACVLLIALWVRSYWREDIVSWGPDNGGGYMLGSWWAELSLAYFPRREGNVELGWCAWSSPARATRAWYSTPMTEFMGFRGKRFPSGSFIVVLPHWFPVVLFAAFAALPWARQMRWRFSLRTLLIATTLVAVVLGLAAYAVR